jgi:hypothetical protein
VTTILLLDVKSAFRTDASREEMLHLKRIEKTEVELGNQKAV